MKVLAFTSLRYRDFLLQGTAKKSKPSEGYRPAKGYRADDEVNYYLKLNPQPPPHAEIPFSRLLRQAVDHLGGNLVNPRL